MAAGDKPFFDTNVLVYAFCEDDRRKHAARELLAQGGATGVQSLNEFVSVMKSKIRMSWREVLDALAAIRVLCPAPLPVTVKTHDLALRIATHYGYRIYDSLIVAAALEASCSTLYSGDMHDGQVIETLTIRNPFRRAAR